MTARNILVCIALLTSLAGCASWNARHHHSASSLVQFLYPNQTDMVMPQGVSELTIPMRVGVAMVPGNWPESMNAEREKALLSAVQKKFTGRPDIERIEVIPSTYLRANGGFTNLKQLRQMFNIESIALVSLDQTQNSDSTAASIVLWTIVGGYVFPSEANSTHTMLDTAVIHIPSERLLFRAPGTSSSKNLSTDVGVERSLRKASARGFDDALSPMLVNLDAALTDFRAEVAKRPEDFKVNKQAGYSGGGAISVWFAGLILVGFGLVGFGKRTDS